MKIGDLVWLGQRLADAGRAEIRGHAPDIPTAELILMGHLMDSAPSTITALADRSGYAQSRVSTAVSNLVSRGWARTGSDPADGRRTVVYVPDELRQQAEAFRTGSEARTLEHLLAGLTADRRAEIVDALEELLLILRRRITDDQLGPDSALHRGLSSPVNKPSSPRRPRSAGPGARSEVQGSAKNGRSSVE